MSFCLCRMFIKDQGPSRVTKRNLLIKKKKKSRVTKYYLNKKNKMQNVFSCLEHCVHVGNWMVINQNLKLIDLVVSLYIVEPCESHFLFILRKNLGTVKEHNGIKKTMKRIYISGNIYIYIYDVGQIRNLSTFSCGSCGGFWVRNDEELERS